MFYDMYFNLSVFSFKVTDFDVMLRKDLPFMYIHEHFILVFIASFKTFLTFKKMRFVFEI